jgi:hypothetical protein
MVLWNVDSKIEYTDGALPTTFTGNASILNK